MAQLEHIDKVNNVLVGLSYLQICAIFVLLIGAGGTWTYGEDSGIPGDTIRLPSAYDPDYLMSFIIFSFGLYSLQA